MRILHLLDHVPADASAYSRRVMAILREQRALGWHTCQLVGAGAGASASAGAGTTSSAQRNASRWHFYRTPASGAKVDRLPLVGKVNLVARRLHHVVKLTRPDLLHVHSPLVNAMAALRVGRQQRLPVVFEAHAPSPWSTPGSIWTPPDCNNGGGIACHANAQGEAATRLTCFALRALEAWTAARASAVVTNSDAMRRRLHDGGVRARRITVVPDGVDLARVRMIGERERTPTARLQIGVVIDGDLPLVDAPDLNMRAQGSYRPGQTGMALVLAALALLRRSHTQADLLIACGSAQRDRLQRYWPGRCDERPGDLLPAASITILQKARRGSAGSQASLAHSASGAEVPLPCMVVADPIAELHRLADLLVFADIAPHAVAPPSRQLLEAMARGCVVVVADTPAQRSVVEHGRSGMLFAAGDAAALARTLQQLLAARASWPALRAGARWCIEYQRGWDVCVKRYMGVYEALLARRRR